MAPADPRGPPENREVDSPERLGTNGWRPSYVVHPSLIVTLVGAVFQTGASAILTFGALECPYGLSRGPNPTTAACYPNLVFAAIILGVVGIANLLATAAAARRPGFRRDSGILTLALSAVALAVILAGSSLGLLLLVALFSSPALVGGALSAALKRDPPEFRRQQNGDRHGSRSAGG